MEARRVPTDAQRPASGRSFTAPSADGGAPQRAERVRSINSASSRSAAERPAVRSLGRSTAEAATTPSADSTPAQAQDTDTTPTTDNTTNNTSSRSTARRAAIAGVAAAGAMSAAACGGSSEPASPTALDNLTATCYRETVPEGDTRGSFVVRMVGPLPGEETEQLMEDVRTRNNENFILWTTPRSTDSNELGSVVWACPPGSLHEVKGAANEYVNPEAVAVQDPTALEGMANRRGQ